MVIVFYEILGCFLELLGSRHVEYHRNVKVLNVLCKQISYNYIM